MSPPATSSVARHQAGLSAEHGRRLHCGGRGGLKITNIRAARGQARPSTDLPHQQGGVVYPLLGSLGLHPLWDECGMMRWERELVTRWCKGGRQRVPDEFRGVCSP